MAGGGVGSWAEAGDRAAEGDGRFHDWLDSLSNEEFELWVEGKLSVGERLEISEGACGSR